LLTSAWRWIRERWWIAASLVVAVLALVAGVIFKLMKPSTQTDESPGPMEPMLDTARERVERVRLEGEVERARVTATADAERHEIDRIEEVGKTDPMEGRRRMAEWLVNRL
jgi:hypothetical protein